MYIFRRRALNWWDPGTFGSFCACFGYVGFGGFVLGFFFFENRFKNHLEERALGAAHEKNISRQLTGVELGQLRSPSVWVGSQ